MFLNRTSCFYCSKTIHKYRIKIIQSVPFIYYYYYFVFATAYTPRFFVVLRESTEYFIVHHFAQDTLCIRLSNYFIINKIDGVSRLYILYETNKCKTLGVFLKTTFFEIFQIIHIKLG